MGFWRPCPAAAHGLSIGASSRQSGRSFFLNVDFVRHLALVAISHDDGRPTTIGGARCIVVQPGIAEAAFTVADYEASRYGVFLMLRR